MDGRRRSKERTTQRAERIWEGRRGDDLRRGIGSFGLSSSRFELCLERKNFAFLLVHDVIEVGDTFGQLVDEVLMLDYSSL